MGIYVNTDLKRHWSSRAKGLSPYVAGEQPVQKFIKLNTNENAYPPSPKVALAVANCKKDLRLYPNTDAQIVCQAVANLEGVSSESVFCANGSDEALAFCFMAFFDPDLPIKIMDITYSFYPVWAKLFDITLKKVALKTDFSADVAELCGGNGAIIANPNAPTGIALALDEIEQIVKSTEGVVIIDEAYIAFGAKSAVSLIKDYENLVIVRTLSKSHSLAGLRVGYALANPSLVAALNAVKDSFNSYTVDTLAQAGAAAAIADDEYYAKTTALIIEQRERTRNALINLGYEVLPSMANFIFVKCKDAENTFLELRERGILVRHFAGGRTQDFLRVTIGTANDMQKFLDAMAILV